MIDHLSGFPKKLELRHYLFLLVLLAALFLRFWNIPNTVQFLGDQGRDALIVSRIFKEGDLVFIGPVTSVGNMYLGPLYYYFMVPFLWLSYPSPLGPVYAVAFLGFLTIYLMYVFGKEMIGEKAALIAATLMAFSATVISGTRFSWNPNPAPLVSLVMYYFVYKALKNDSRFWIGVIACFAVLIQLHYLTLLSAAGIGVLWLWQIYGKLKLLKDEKKSKSKTLKSIKKIVVSTLIGAVIFFASLTPLLLFDLKHDGLNYNAFKNILVGEDAFEQKSPELSGKIGEYVRETLGAGKQILFETTVSGDKNINTFFLAITFLVLVLSFQNGKKDKYFLGKLIILAFLTTGIFGVGLYQHAVYNHYIAYLFPIVFFTLGLVGEYLFKKNLLGKAVVVFFLILFASHNIYAMKDVLKSIGGKIERVQQGADSILQRVEVGEKYDIVLLTGTGDIEGQNYRYFLSTTDKPPVLAEERGNIDTLFIINDDRVLKKVTDSPIYEIVVFPNKNPSEVYEIEDGPEITVLRRN